MLLMPLEVLTRVSQVIAVRTLVSQPLNNQIKKLLVLGAASSTINDQGCQHVTGRFESIRMLSNKPLGWPKFVQSHLTVKTVE